MTKTPEEKEFEKGQLAYEQNCVTFRALNQLMWQIPLIAMTLTGGLWFGVTKVGDSIFFKEALLLLAAAGNVGLIIVLTRLRFLMGAYLAWLKNYNEGGFVAGEGTGLNRPRMVRTVFQILLGGAAVISVVLMVIMWVETNRQKGDEMGSLRSLAYYDRHARELADNYESIDFEDAHPELAKVLIDDVKDEIRVLDVGAGSGRDAAWTAAHGNTVMAVDPSEAMLTLARARHRDRKIEWLNDSLPNLKRVQESKEKFDAILLSAVWMHVHPNDRSQAIASLTSVLKPGGRVYMTLRKGPPSSDRGIYRVSVEEVARLARSYGLEFRDLGEQADLLGRREVRWHSIVLSTK